MPHPKPVTNLMTKPVSKTIYIPVPYGELVDKITILTIKKNRISDPVKLGNIKNELNRLQNTYQQYFDETKKLKDLRMQLLKTNEALWEIEDAIRLCEKYKDFGRRFVELARSVYKQNDQRSLLKRKINNLLGSDLMEEKSYTQYE